MVMAALKYPFCQSENVRKHGHSNGKQRYLCENDECSHKTFYADYTYNACTPSVRLQIIRMSIDGSGIRATARVLEISTSTVISVLKKEELISYVNEDYFRTHDNIKVHIEMDEMWNFYYDKKHQIWLGGR